MDTQKLSEIERYERAKHLLVPVFDGERAKVRSFGFRNPHDEPFQMLIHLIRK